MKLEANKWYPIEEYHKRNNMDWALVQFKETKTGFMPLPIVAEFNRKDRVWETRSDMDRYFCEMCEAVAFMLWLPYDERDRELFLKSLEDKRIDEARKEEMLKNALIKFFVQEMSLYTDTDGLKVIATYKVYLEDLKNKYPNVKPLSEEEYNLIKEAIEEIYGK